MIANLLNLFLHLGMVKNCGFSSHRKISSTERYRQTDLEELKAAVLKHHPLG